MSRAMIAYSKSVLESVSFNSELFCKELQKAVKMLLPYEIEELTIWFFNFIKEKPELRHCQIYLTV